MTRMLEPTLLIRRFLVTASGTTAFSAHLHNGVNIFAGSNGSGKSTIADLIFFGLGGDAPKLKEEALQCDYTYAEVEINGETATLRREISPKIRRPMAISWAPLEEARQDAIEGWELYPFAAASTKLSFSQVMFRALGIPEALRGDLASIITMHQLLRVIYVDQETPFSAIFRSDNFDSPITRSGVGDLMLGMYDPSLYSLRLELGEKKKQLSAVNAQYTGARQVLRQADSLLTRDMLLEARAEAKEQRSRVASRLESLEEAEEAVSEELREQTSERRLEVRDQLVKRNSEVRRAYDKLETLEFEIQDSASFIEALEKRLQSLDEASETRQALGSVVFSACPACFSVLEEREAGLCHVCGRGSTTIADNVARLRHELEMQLQESTALQDDRENERQSLLNALPQLQEERAQLQREYDQLSTGVRTGFEEEMARLNREIGYLDRQSQDLESKIRIAESIEQLAAEREKLQTEIGRLEGRISDLSGNAQKHRGEAEALIGSLTADMLREDLPREYKFEKAERVTFDFGDNEMAVGGKTAFAASSSVLLKNAFHFAMLFASLQSPRMRYPRFLLCDNMEDKGMEQARSHNFQRIVVERSRRAEAAHQIIFTTSMLNPELDVDEFVVAKFSRTTKSLSLPASE